MPRSVLCLGVPPPPHPPGLVSDSLHFMLAGFVPEPEEEGLCDTPEWDDVSEEAKCTLVVVVVVVVVVVGHLSHI